MADLTTGQDTDIISPLGSGTESGAVLVTLATDSSGLLSVDDNASSLTVDALNDGSLNVQVGDGSNTATIRNLAANDALNVAIVDASGDQITSFGGGTQYSEDAAHNTGDTGTMTLAVRNDTLAALAGTDGDYTPLQVDENGALYTAAGNFVSTNNSTTTPLGVSGNFTGTGDDCLGYSTVVVTLYADVDSAADGMKFEFSTDNTNWDDTYSFTMDVSASDTRRFQFPVTARYFRVNYTNGGGGQSAFRVQTILHTGNQLTSVHRLVDDISPDRSAQVVKSAVFAQVSGTGDFTAIASNAQGKLQVAADCAGIETPADADATPTDAVHVQSFNSVYNGTTWDLVREGATAGSILVDGSAVTQPVSGTVTANPASGTIDTVTTVTAVTDITNNVTVDHPTTALGDGVKTVTTAGTDEALAGSTACKWVTVQAQTDNTNEIAVGATGVDATIATGTGIILFPGDSITIEIDNLADVFVDAITDGEGVRYFYGT